jgi:hypothetical protein
MRLAALKLQVQQEKCSRQFPQCCKSLKKISQSVARKIQSGVRVALDIDPATIAF